jgi:hypothetical protein
MKNKDRGIKGWVLKSFVEPLLKGFTTAPVDSSHQNIPTLWEKLVHDATNSFCYFSRLTLSMRV